jgi:hypothetical protein
MNGPAEAEVAVFRDARPAVPDYPSAARARARARLLTAAQAEQDRTGQRAQRRARLAAPGALPGRAHWRIVAGVVAVTAVTGLAAGVLLTAVASSPGGRPSSAAGRRPSSAASTPAPRQSARAAAGVLELAAVTAARQPAPPVPGPGQFLYLRDVEAKGGTGCGTNIGQEWMAPDGAGRQTGTYPSRKCAGSDFTQSWPKGQAPGDNPIDWPLNLLGWQSLPGSPAAIEQVLIRRYEGGRASAEETFTYATAFLQEDAPPALRAALFRVIERLPGVQNLGSATDQLGRRGQGVGLVQDGMLQELIFNPATSVALDVQFVAVGPRQDGNNYQPAGTSMGYTLYVASGVVDSDTATLPAYPGLPPANRARQSKR